MLCCAALLCFARFWLCFWLSWTGQLETPDFDPLKPIKNRKLKQNDHPDQARPGRPASSVQFDWKQQQGLQNQVIVEIRCKFSHGTIEWGGRRSQRPFLGLPSQQRRNCEASRGELRRWCKSLPLLKRWSCRFLCFDPRTVFQVNIVFFSICFSILPSLFWGGCSFAVAHRSIQRVVSPWTPHSTKPR